MSSYPPPATRYVATVQFYRDRMRHTKVEARQYEFDYPGGFLNPREFGAGHIRQQVEADRLQLGAGSWSFEGVRQC